MGVSPAFNSLCPSAWWPLFSPKKTGREASGADRAWEQVKCLLGEGGRSSFLLLPKQLKFTREITEILIHS